MGPLTQVEVWAVFFGWCLKIDSYRMRMVEIEHKDDGLSTRWAAGWPVADLCSSKRFATFF